MTVKHMIELVQQQFPAFSRTQVLFEINKALRRFCANTQVYNAVTVLDRDDDYVSVDDDGVETWEMPNDTYEIISIDELYKDSYELRDTDLMFYPPNRQQYDELLVRYSRIPSVLVNDTDTPVIPETFHDALVSSVLAKYHRKSGDFNNATAELMDYKQAEQEAKRYVNTMRLRNTGAFVGDNMANIVAYGTKSLAAGVNTVDMGKTFTSITSYYVMLNGNGIDVQEYDPNNDNAERTTSSFKVVSADANENFEWFAIGQ